MFLFCKHSRDAVTGINCCHLNLFSSFYENGEINHKSPCGVWKTKLPPQLHWNSCKCLFPFPEMICYTSGTNSNSNCHFLHVKTVLHQQRNTANTGEKDERDVHSCPDIRGIDDSSDGPDEPCESIIDYEHEQTVKGYSWGGEGGSNMV